MKSLLLILSSVLALSATAQAATVSTVITCGHLEKYESLQAGIVRNSGLLELVLVTSRIYGTPRTVTVPVREITSARGTLYFNEDQSVSLRVDRTSNGVRGTLNATGEELSGFSATDLLCAYESTITAKIK